MKITKILASAAVASLVAGTVAATASAYTGAISFQTTDYSFRNGMFDTTYAPYWADGTIVWPDGEALDQSFPDYADYFDWDIEAYVFPVTYTDVAIDADGTYTVAVDGFVWGVDGASGFNFVQISTDLPVDGSVTVSDAKLIVDGEVTATLAEPPVEGTDGLVINVVNTYNTECPTYTGAYPTDNLAVEFTVTGLGGAAVDTDAPATDAGDKTSPDTGVEGVAAVAGLAVVAGGALVLSKKRK